LIPLLILASVSGDSVNYFIGRNFGRALFQKNLFFLKKEYLVTTEEFFEKRGVWAVSLSRFFPIIRTMAPFFAGMSLLRYRKFLLLSILGSVAWVLTFCLAGFFFGQIEFIKNNFTIFVLAIFIIPGIPFAFGILKALKSKYFTTLQ
ncbi:MAG: VTT domain-containing protein, partial [Pseudobdellovibrio sp.]